MVHDALDELFAQPPDKRNKDVLHDLFRSVWLKKKEKYVEELFPTVESQRAFGLAGLKLLSNYFKVRLRYIPFTPLPPSLSYCLASYLSIYVGIAFPLTNPSFPPSLPPFLPPSLPLGRNPCGTRTRHA